MDIPRLFILLSTIAFVAAVIQAVAVLRAGRWNESRWHLLPVAAGFALQTAFLYLRGQARGRCPLTNQFEIFIFIGWCIVLLFFVLGPAYRLSLLGVFTSPLVASLQTVALLLAGTWDGEPELKGSVTMAGELHKTVALVAYAAFALACISGVMFLLQDHLLKKHRINALFHQLPPIHQLSKAIVRMVFLGVVLLSIALAAALQIGIPVTHAGAIFSWGVWTLYLVLLLLMWRHALSARRTAWLAIGGFAIVFISIWIVAK